MGTGLESRISSPGGWLIENCPTTKGEKCPICAHNSGLWNSGREADKDIARKQKRKLSYFANIYVIKDPLNPENEGQVFLYKFGKRIFDKLTARMQPDENDYDPQPAINPFDLWKGADFKLKIKQVAGYWNYDDSSFNAASTLGNFDDSKLEEIYNSSYSLEEFTDESNFKSYEQLDERLKAVLGQAVQPKSFETDKYDHAQVSQKPPVPNTNWKEEVESFSATKTVASATTLTARRGGRCVKFLPETLQRKINSLIPLMMHELFPLLFLKKILGCQKAPFSILDTMEWDRFETKSITKEKNILNFLPSVYNRIQKQIEKTGATIHYSSRLQMN